MAELFWNGYLLALNIVIHAMFGILFRSFTMGCVPLAISVYNGYLWSFPSDIEELVTGQPAVGSIILLNLHDFTLHAMWFVWLVCVVAVREKRRAMRATLPCVACGYSLVGNTTGVCPECGHKQEAEPPAPDRDTTTTPPGAERA